jgi:hypothetical protein
MLWDYQTVNTSIQSAIEDDPLVLTQLGTLRGLTEVDETVLKAIG